MTEKLAIDTLKALGVKDVTTNRQKKNGTTCFELPTGDTVAEFSSGYIRKYLTWKGKKLTCYQLNPVYKSPYKETKLMDDDKRDLALILFGLALIFYTILLTINLIN